MFGMTYEYWKQLPYKEKLRYQYYITMKTKKEQHEVEKARKEAEGRKWKP